MENGHEPASKQDIELLRSEMERLRSEVRSEFGQVRSEIGQVRSEVRSEFEQVRSEFHHEFDELKETIRDSQTEILRAFYGYTQTTDAKLREGEQSDMALRQRLTAVESRILEVEKRLNMPPAA
jgi:ABC-type phosphate transport system auxiliary subunit